MQVSLKRISVEEIPQLWSMHVRAFRPIWEKYHQDASDQSIETMIRRFHRQCSDYYMIYADEKPAGGVCVIRRKERRCNISSLFVIPEMQRRGIAQTAMKQLEELYSDVQWELNTILQETGNCRLYEKMGYRRTGEIEVIGEHMTLVYYRKRRRSERQQL